MIYATNNQAKLIELNQISPVKIESYQNYLAQPVEIAETKMTYKDNAKLKALTIAKKIQRPVLGDDGGLELVDFPHLLGVHTKRFFESHLTDQAMNEQILALYKPGVSYSRKAYLVASLVYAYPDGKVIEAECRLPFRIPTTLMGQEGYGFDSILLIPNLNKTVAQLSKSKRLQYSARLCAFKQLLRQLKGE